VTFACDPSLFVRALRGVPLVAPGDDLATLVVEALGREELSLRDADVLVVASKVVSRSEGRFVDLQTVIPSAEARALGEEIEKDPRVVELILRESASISRKARGVLVVRHRLGFISANAGIDASNAGLEGAPKGSGPWLLLLPEAPDRSAEALRIALAERTGARIGVVISDSLGRPFRLGTQGAAIGVAGLPPLWDRRGDPDLFGRTLEMTIAAVADPIAAIADLVAGQGDEGRPFALVRGVRFEPGGHGANELVRPADQDLYA